MRDGCAVRNGGGTQAGCGRALKLRVELFDFGLEGGDLVAKGAGPVGNRVNLFFHGPHMTMSVAQQHSHQHGQRTQGHQHQRPGHRQAEPAQLPEAGVGERRRRGCRNRFGRGFLFELAG